VSPRTLGGGKLHPLRGLVREWVSKVVGIERNIDRLGFAGANGDDLHVKVILIWEFSSSEEAKPLGPIRADNAVASENIVDTNSVVEIVTGLGGSEIVHIVICRLTPDL